MVSSGRAMRSIVGGGHNGLVAGGVPGQAGLRTVVLEARADVGGAATTETPWGPDFKVTALSYVMSLMPDAILEGLDLERHGYRSSRWARRTSAARRPRPCCSSEDPAGPLRERGRVLEGGRRGPRAVGRVDGGHRRRAGPAAHEVAAAGRLEAPERPGRPAPAGVEAARASTCATAADVDPAVHDEHRATCSASGSRPTPMQGVHGGQRHHRHLGRARRAGHRVRDAAPLHRRRRRRQRGRLGLPRRRHGRGVGRDPARGRVLRCGRAHRRSGRAHPRRRAGGSRASRSSTARSCRAPMVVAATHPQLTFLRQLDPACCPTTSSPTSRHWRSRSGTVKVNVALSELPDFVADPGTSCSRTTPGPSSWPTRWSTSRRPSRTPAAAGRRRARSPTACIPSTFDRTLCPEGTHIMALFTQWVPDAWAAEPHDDELEAYADRVVDGYTELAPELQASRSSTARSSAPTRWSTPTG